MSHTEPAPRWRDIPRYVLLARALPIPVAYIGYLLVIYWLFSSIELEFLRQLQHKMLEKAQTGVLNYGEYVWCILWSFQYCFF